MDFSLNGKNVHASTGGVAFDASRPVVVFLHGAGMDHTVWFLQSRWFAYRGRAVLALDFPGHGGSDGPLLTSIEDMADWVAAVLDQLGVKQAAIVGHSMGALAAISFAARHPAKARTLGLVVRGEGEGERSNFDAGERDAVVRRGGRDIGEHTVGRLQRKEALWFEVRLNPIESGTPGTIEDSFEVIDPGEK